MKKFNLEKDAKEEAQKNRLCYGWSIYSPGWYVGTRQQLQAIGVLDPVCP